MIKNLKKKSSISVIVLTYNEEENIEHCLKSLEGWVEEIFIVDSFSTDKTLELAKKYTGKIYQHPWENYEKQFNWALDNFPLSGDWVMRLDADEFVTSELSEEISSMLPSLPPDITGLYVKRKVYFMGRWIKHGGYYPTWLLRVFRRGRGKFEERFHDEHITIDVGKTLQLKHDIIDHNHKGLYFWIEKHNRYSSLEKLNVLNIDGKDNLGIDTTIRGTQASRKRWLAKKVYLRFPMFVRAFLYFIFRYFLQLGFLDGKEGLIFHFLHGFWYRFLVDAKIYEHNKGLR